MRRCRASCGLDVRPLATGSRYWCPPRASRPRRGEYGIYCIPGRIWYILYSRGRFWQVPKRNKVYSIYTIYLIPFGRVRSMPCHALPPCHATFRAMPRHAMPPSLAMPRHAAKPRHATPCRATPCHAAPGHATPRLASPRLASPRLASQSASKCI